MSSAISFMSNIKPSFLIASDQPRELSFFYSKVIEGQFSQGYSSTHFSVLKNDLVVIQIFKPSLNSNFIQETNSSVALCFERDCSSSPLDELNAWCSQIISFGAVLKEGPSDKSFGAEAWFADPENNSFLIFVPLEG